ncbi:Dopey, N-terminal-domain-containing protein [Myxozyma melibiosi]|uniref:Dopey, N-terminal-domain-containing protein n=1 Tax=Myxozyma melibiosi TaxID=54550 RepID=A0ABR1F7T6_9ASCO
MAPSAPSTSSILQTISPLPFILSKSEDSARKKDPKYKRYAANIDRALALFESVEEWADYISFLGKLLRALQSHTAEQVPYSPIIANRLAQSLHPNLPSGVHQKALELYGYIFSMLGKDELARELNIWIPGLLPLMAYASINVKPHLIHILETCILPLPAESLRPIVRPLILSLLPGIDDETSESFNAVLTLIDSFRAHIGDDQYFWQCFFLVVLSSADRRLGAAIYAARRFPSINTVPSDKTKDELLQIISDDVKAIVTPEPGLLVRALGKGLEDDQVLVQRGFLELLVRNVQLQSGAVQTLVAPHDLMLLMMSASSVVLRRDMSLNRRLWTWLLGPEPSPDHPATTPHLSRSEYFQKFGITPLVNGLNELIASTSPDPVARAKPYRIALSLMDRWEVGGVIIPGVLLPIVRSVRRYRTEAKTDADYQEVLRSASAFFDGVEAGSIWLDGFLLVNRDHDLDLLLFIMKTFNVREEEMVIVHLPLILISLFIIRKRGVEVDKKVWLELASEVLSVIPARALLPTEKSELSTFNSDEIVAKISQFYNRSPDDPSTPPFLPATISWLLLTATAELCTSTLKELDPDAGDICIMLVNLLAKIPGEKTWRNEDLVAALLSLKPGIQVPFKVLYGATRLLGIVIERNGMERQEIDISIRNFTELHWGYLSQPTGKFHVESVTSLWDLQSKCKDHKIEAAISNLVADAHAHPNSGYAFINLWAHSVDYANFEAILTRPLLLMLDSLEDKYSPLRSVSLAWLDMLAATSTTNRLYGILVSRILKLPFLRRQVYSFGEDDDLELFLYYLKTLTNILDMGPPSLCASLATDMISVDASRSNLLQHIGLEDGDPSYRGFFIRVILRTLKYDIPPDSSPQLQESLSKVLRGALQLLDVILTNPDRPMRPELAVEQALTSRLSSSTFKNDIYTQTLILDVLFRTLKVNYGSSRTDNSKVHPDSVIKLRESLDVTPAVDGQGSRSPTSSLIQCVIEGLSTDENQPVLDSWVKFLIDCLPFFSDVLFQILIPMVECFCTQIKTDFEDLKVVYSSKSSSGVKIGASEGALFALMHGLEHLMVAAHDKLLDEEQKTINPKTPSEPGFFGTVISGVFSVESPQARSAAANNRLTVLLCFQDCIRINHSIWLWGEEIAKGAKNKPDSASHESFMYISSRMKYRARRILERLYLSETLESLETLVDIHKQYPVFKLLHVLDGSRPKLTFPFVLNAIYSRINPMVLEQSYRSTLTTDLTDYQLVEFLVDYVSSLDNDAIEEIWMDCMTFVKDVQANISLYRHVLPNVLVFISIIGSKVDSTNFGEQRRLRKELADVFLKLLNSSVASRQVTGLASPEPSALSSVAEKDKYVDSDESQAPSLAQSTATTLVHSDSVQTLRTASSFQALPSLATIGLDSGSSSKPKVSQEELCRALAIIVPNLQKVLLESDRVAVACTIIGASVITPALKSKGFPASASAPVLEVLYQTSRVPNSQKAWKTSVTDAYYDSKFFTMSEALRPRWRDVIKQWLGNDKERIPDLISRVSAHSSTTNVVFGWSDQESIARRLNLRRLAFAFMCGETDQFLVNLKETLDKLSELVSSSVTESIRSDVFLCLRAIILRTSPVHLPPYWTFIYTELTSIFTALTNEDPNTLRENKLQNIFAAAKLLDSILVLGPEEFQLHYWLFIKDSLEAAFPRLETSPLPLIDRLSLLMGTPMETTSSIDPASTSLTQKVKRTPMLRGQTLSGVSELKQFFSKLSITTYEWDFNLGEPDIEALEEEVYADIFM